MAEIAERSQRLVTDFLNRSADGSGGVPAELLNLGAAFLALTTRMMADPARLAEAQASLWRDTMVLWQNTSQRMLGAPVEPVARPGPDDRRFRDRDWEKNPLFDYIKQSYLLSARWLVETVRETDGLDDRTAKKVDFYTRQFVDAMAPSNFLMTNPEVLRTTLDTGGENLVKGLANLLEDLERGKGRLQVRMTDMEAFRVGENIAVSAGKVVFENALMQLIQYAPRTKTVHRRPLLIVPPWINKYYILDLRPENSFIGWAVEQGHTVFVISWVNPDARLAEADFEDYLGEGPLAALDAMAAATGEREANAIGYCLGGTLLACALAYLAEKGDTRVKSATFFAAQFDFSEPGELAVFIDDAQIAYLEQEMEKKGYLDGAHMATTFNMLRANDLIWSFVVNNYLLGKDPFPFDLLYWNSDSTRLPAAMHSFYLRNMYQNNLLAEPGGITLLGVPIDLGAVTVPSFMVATREDHIAPWLSAYRATGLVSGPARFVLAASGHIAGIINPPGPRKYVHWTNARTPREAEAWLAGATEHPGSWWPVWARWVARRGGGRVPARAPGAGALAAIEDAPGRYVKVGAID